MERSAIAKLIEAILFVADEPVPTSDLAVLLEESAAEVDAVLASMAESFSAEGRGLAIVQVAGGWRLASVPEAAPYLERFVAEQRNSRLSQAALETLAIVAYRQPISRGQVAEIRGVDSDRALRSLLIRGAIEEAGRDAGPGRAILYKTTSSFLEKIGLLSLEDLPKLDAMMPGSEALERMEMGLGPGL